MLPADSIIKRADIIYWGNWVNTGFRGVDRKKIRQLFQIDNCQDGGQTQIRYAKIQQANAAVVAHHAKRYHYIAHLDVRGGCANKRFVLMDQAYQVLQPHPRGRQENIKNRCRHASCQWNLQL